jgi:hypothetical protein
MLAQQVVQAKPSTHCIWTAFLKHVPFVPDIFSESGEDLVHDVAVNIGQTSVNAVMPEG